jgi:GAF domain-containing protein
LRFETLISDISARFVNMPVSHADQEIEGAQRTICEYLGVDHSSLWQTFGKGANCLVLTHLFQSPGLPPAPDRMMATESFPWAQRKLQAKEILCVPDITKAPPEAARDSETLRQFGMKSTLGIPLSSGGGPVFGVLSFDDTQQARDWPESLQKRLQLVAQVFANVLERRHAQNEYVLSGR